MAHRRPLCEPRSFAARLRTHRNGPAPARRQHHLSRMPNDLSIDQARRLLFRAGRLSTRRLAAGPQRPRELPASRSGCATPYAGCRARAAAPAACPSRHRAARCQCGPAGGCLCGRRRARPVRPCAAVRRQGRGYGSGLRGRRIDGRDLGRIVTRGRMAGRQPVCHDPDCDRHRRSAQRPYCTRRTGAHRDRRQLWHVVGDRAWTAVRPAGADPPRCANPRRRAADGLGRCRARFGLPPRSRPAGVAFLARRETSKALVSATKYSPNPISIIKLWLNCIISPNSFRKGWRIAFRLITLSVILPESRQLAGDDAMYPVGQNVLIVDDDLGRGQAIERILREEGFAVTIATEGFAALRAAGSEQFALVIAAVELPGTLDGVTTVRRLRARQPWLKALFTGEFARGPRWAGRDCDEFIAAPFHRRELLGCVFELLQRESLPGADLVRRSRLELDSPAPRPI